MSTTQQIDGMGGVSSSTSKIVILRKSGKSGCDIDYRFGQAAIDSPLIDWSGIAIAAIAPGTRVSRTWADRWRQCASATRRDRCGLAPAR